MIFSRVVIFF